MRSVPSGRRVREEEEEDKGDWDLKNEDREELKDRYGL
jgi:hypothetical protein